jgi:hypothetical protein
VDETYEDWQRLKQALPRDRFLARFAHPFLVRQTQPQRRLATSATTQTLQAVPDDWTEKFSFDTAVRDPADPTPGPAALALRGARIHPIVKQPSNPFPDRISLGRAQNCDIVLREASVSKLHAHFRLLSKREAELTDTRSANGTRVNARPIPAITPVRVTSGDMILFGAVAVQFIDPDKLFDLL